MTKINMIIILILTAVSGLFAMDEASQEGYDLFYNYQFEKAEKYFKDNMLIAEDPFPYYAFYSYSKIRASLANAEYDIAMDNADKTIHTYRPVFESYLQLHPEDVHAQIWALIVFQTWWKKYMN